MMSSNFLLNVEQYLCTAYIPHYRDNNVCFLKKIFSKHIICFYSIIIIMTMEFFYFLEYKIYT